MSDPNYQPPEHACEYLLRTCAVYPALHNRARLLDCLSAQYEFDETYVRAQYGTGWWNKTSASWNVEKKKQPFKYTNVRKFTYEFCNRELLIKIKTARADAHIILTENE